MSKENTPLHMIRIQINTKKFFDFANKRRLINPYCEETYAVHSLMYELWGNLAPKPFYISNWDAQNLFVLGYSRQTKINYIDHANAFADPFCHSIIDWQSIEDKPMPSVWNTGMIMGFKIRVCPILRTQKNNSENKPVKAISEHDIYLAYLEKAKQTKEEPSMTRFEIYSQWLKQQLEIGRAFRLENVNVSSFQLATLQRRNKKRNVTLSKRPDVTLQGVIRVLDGKLVNSMLERGIGRHRAFGFGMLLLHTTTSE